jgi:hypothetical protein
MNKRKLSDGSHPIVGYFIALLIVCAFVGLSIFVFKATMYAPYLYVLVALFFASQLSEIKRNEFLKFHFGKSQYRKVRMLENVIITLPFVIFLMCNQEFYPAIFLVVTTIVMALLNFKTAYSIPIPTPFYKKPFEFTVGFRNTFFMFPIAYAVAIIAIIVDNYNLGIFSLALVFLSVLSYYLNPENEYFVWVYGIASNQFLIEKIKTAFLFSLYLCCPIILLLSIFYFENLGILLLSTLMGFLYLAAFILAKYSAFPQKMDLGQELILIICLFLPPLLIAAIPFFAIQSTKKLKPFLQ